MLHADKYENVKYAYDELVLTCGQVLRPTAVYDVYQCGHSVTNCQTPCVRSNVQRCFSITLLSHNTREVSGGLTTIFKNVGLIRVLLKIQ